MTPARDDLPRERWQALWQRLGGSAATGATAFDLLRAAYQDPGRAYHGTAHVRACLRWLDDVAGHRHGGPAVAERPDEVEVALWFHDAVYDTRRFDNEDESAALWTRHAQAAGIGPDTVARVAAMIEATRHHRGDGDVRLVVEIDLSILGADAETYDGFEDAIAREYAWVPALVYRAGRKAVLSGFLARPRIFTLPALDALEAPARDNLKRALARL